MNTVETRKDFEKIPEEVLEAAYKENTVWPFLRMADNARNAGHVQIARTLQAMAGYVGEQDQKMLEIDDFVSSPHAEGIPLKHLSIVRVALAVADVSNQIPTNAQGIYHRRGNSHASNNEVAAVYSLLNPTGEAHVVGQQKNVEHYRQNTNMGIEIFTSVGPNDISINASIARPSANKLR